MNEAGQAGVVIYDGDCSFCRGQISRIQAKDTHDRFSYLPRQTPGITDEYPALAEGDFNTGMRLIMPDGVIHVGADAVYQIARRLPGWRRMAWLYRVPVLHTLARIGYAIVAKNRQRLGRTCDDGACDITTPSKTSRPS